MDVFGIFIFEQTYKNSCEYLTGIEQRIRIFVAVYWPRRII